MYSFRWCSSFEVPVPCARRSRQVGCTAAKMSTLQLKQELLNEADRLNRGVDATEDDKNNIENIAKSLEKVNPNPKSLSSSCINGRWRLRYTTSASILGTSRPAPLRPSGPIFQIIDAENLKARNNESFPFFNSVTANLTPVTDSKVNVKFQQFKILNLIPVTAPDSARGSLDTTYVDDELRISRGDKGNLFVLTMDDPTARLKDQL